jgi:hypothetical protein
MWLKGVTMRHSVGATGFTPVLRDLAAKNCSMKEVTPRSH